MSHSYFKNMFQLQELDTLIHHLHFPEHIEKENVVLEFYIMFEESAKKQCSYVTVTTKDGFLVTVPIPSFIPTPQHEESGIEGKAYFICRYKDFLNVVNWLNVDNYYQWKIGIAYKLENTWVARDFNVVELEYRNDTFEEVDTHSVICNVRKYGISPFKYSTENMKFGYIFQSNISDVSKFFYNRVTIHQDPIHLFTTKDRIALVKTMPLGCSPCMKGLIPEKDEWFYLKNPSYNDTQEFTIPFEYLMDAVYVFQEYCMNCTSVKTSLCICNNEGDDSEIYYLQMEYTEKERTITAVIPLDVAVTNCFSQHPIFNNVEKYKNDVHLPITTDFFRWYPQQDEK